MLIHFNECARSMYVSLTVFLCVRCSRLSSGGETASTGGKSKSHRYCRHAQGNYQFHPGYAAHFLCSAHIFSIHLLLCYFYDITMCMYVVGSTPSHSGKPNDSGKSSDSSLSSSYRHGHDSGSLRLDQRSKHLQDNAWVFIIYDRFNYTRLSFVVI